MKKWLAKRRLRAIDRELAAIDGRYIFAADDYTRNYLNERKHELIEARKEIELRG